MTIKHVMLKSSVATAFTLLAISSANAADRIKAFCYLNPTTQRIEGNNTEKLVEIASVSKLLTTHWVVATFGATKRFITKVNIDPVGKDLFDVHLSGGMDPVFVKDRILFLASELSRLGVTNIHRLSFDENFHYKDSILAGPAVASDPAGTILDRGQITLSLRRALTDLNKNTTYLTMKKTMMSNSNLTKAGDLKIQSIDPLASNQFTPSNDNRFFTMTSAPVHAILRQMNRKSNNYIANIAFRAMGSADDYKEFILKKLDLDEKDLSIRNGSGYPIRRFVNNAETRFDNRATCSAVVKVIKDLRKDLAKDKLQLADVMALAGNEAKGDGSSTVSRVYSNEKTEDALVAKTGTADPVVALAGAASTTDGLVYFGVMVSDGSPGKASSGRAIIAQQVGKLFKLFGGKKDIGFVARAFSLFDSESRLKEVTPTTSSTKLN